MFKNLREKQAFFNKLEKYFDMPVIVEGDNDKKALDAFGFKIIYVLKESTSLKERIEEIAFLIGRKKEASILTDFDIEGENLHRLLVSSLQDLGVRINEGLRKMFRGARAYHIEESTFLLDSAD